MKKKVLISAILLVALIAVPTIASTAKGPKFPPKYEVEFDGDILMTAQPLFVDEGKGSNWVVAGQNISLELKSVFGACGYGQDEGIALRIDLNGDKDQVEMEMYYNKRIFKIEGCEPIEKVACHFEGSGSYYYDEIEEKYLITLFDPEVTEITSYTARKSCKGYKAVKDTHLIDDVAFDMVIGSIVE